MVMGARKVAAALAVGCTSALKSDCLTPFPSNALAVFGERSGVPRAVLDVVIALENMCELGLTPCESDAGR